MTRLRITPLCTGCQRKTIELLTVTEEVTGSMLGDLLRSSMQMSAYYFKAGNDHFCVCTSSLSCHILPGRRVLKVLAAERCCCYVHVCTLV